MYLGRIVEYADAATLYASPRHPYTRALIAAIPVPDPDARKDQLVLTGDVPSPMNPPSGCHFRTRCPYVVERCRNETPDLRPVTGGQGEQHLAACHRLEEIGT
jgi:peptide/nickel transport system ATP-binding protein/oligopeptide transport system ATP-binding protein